MGDLRARVHGVIELQSQFQAEAKRLVGQVAESLATLDNSRIKQEKLAGSQQSQMSNLMNQAQVVIQRCQETSQEMKEQQWELNSQFVDLNKWRKDGENEIRRERDNQHLLSERVSSSQNESQGNLNHLRQELSEMRQKNRQRTELGHGFDHGSMSHVSGGAKTESQVLPGFVDKTSFVDLGKRHIFLNHTPTPEKNTLPPEKGTLPLYMSQIRR